MVKVKLNGREFYLDGYLHSNLDILKQMVAKKWDGVGYCCGYEGDGKTRISSTIVYYLDPTMTLDRVAFTSDQFLDYCLNAKPHQAILFDESFLTFNNRALWQKSTQAIISMLTMIRRKQLYIMIVAPTFFDINRYIAIHRSRFMIEVYVNGLERGYFRFFNRERKHQLYIKGRKDHNMKVMKPNFTGRFTNFFPFDEVAYENKKDAATNELKSSINKKEEAMNPLVINRLKVDAQSEIIAWLRVSNLLKQGALTQLSRYYEIGISGLDRRLSKNTPVSATSAGFKPI